MWRDPRGIDLISETLETCEQSGWRMCYVRFLGYVAEGLAGVGRLEEALAKLEQDIAWADHSREALVPGRVHAHEGETPAAAIRGHARYRSGGLLPDGH